MRIISGRFRGRQLAAPAGPATRPTADRARQGLFNMLDHAAWSPGLRGVRVLDLFAGSGALGLEALSRGAGSCVFVEHDRGALAVLRANIAGCPLGAGIAVVQARDACSPLRLPAGTGPVDLVLADPPYRQGLAIRALAGLHPSDLAAGAIAVIEEASDHPPEACPGWTPLAHRRYGAATFHVLARTAADVREPR